MKTLSQSRQQPQIIVIQGYQAANVMRNLKSSQKALTVTECISQWEAWLTRNAPKSTSTQAVGYVKAWARDTKALSQPITAVEEGDINAWVNAGDRAKLGTRRVKLAILRGFFRFLSVKELLHGPNPTTLAKVDFNAMSHEQKESRHIKPFTELQFWKLVDHLTTELSAVRNQIEGCKSADLLGKLSHQHESLSFWRSATIISRCSGLRLGDICQLEHACFKDGQFVVWSDKSNKRVQPHIWNRPLFDETVRQIPKVSQAYCFPQQRCDYLNPSRRPGMNTQFGRLCDRLELDLRFHSLRHAYATECMRAGISIPHIAISMGHSNTATTEGYIASEGNL